MKAALSQKLLIAAGANGNEATADGTTPLLKASANGQGAVLLLRLNNADLDSGKKFGKL